MEAVSLKAMSTNLKHSSEEVFSDTAFLENSARTPLLLNFDR